MYGSSEFMLGTQMRVQRANNYQEYAMGYPCTGVELKIANDNGDSVPTARRASYTSRSILCLSVTITTP